MGGLLPVSAFSASVLVSIAAVLSYQFVIYPIFFHPLRHIPSAHWSIPVFGDCWILYQRFRSRNNRATAAAHKKYGDVVRLGYNELSVNCVENGIKTIYGGGFEKHAWYPRQFSNYGAPNMFSTVHHTPHSQKKRTMANVYSKTYVASSAQLAANSQALLAQRFLPLIDDLATTGASVDMHSLDNAFTMDFMTAYQFGLAHSTNFTQNVAERDGFLHRYHSRRRYEFYSSEIPGLKSMLRKFGIHLVPLAIEQVNDLIESWAQGLCVSAERYLDKPTAFVGDEPVVYKQFKHGLSALRKKGTMPVRSRERNSAEDGPLEVYSEMLDHLAAGHETSAVALTYLWYELARHHDVQTQLRQEIQTLTPRIVWPVEHGESSKSVSLPTSQDIDALPLLNAVLTETLRLHAPIPGMQPRVTPPTTSRDGHKLGTYSGIPGGVRVSAMPFTLHRNAAVFPQPEDFVPRRWLDNPPDTLKEMHRWFWAFGSGGRMCIGSHLAIQEIKLIVCALIGNYEVSIAAGRDRDMQEIDAYTVRPKGNQLIMHWKRAQE